MLQIFLCKLISQLFSFVRGFGLISWTKKNVGSAALLMHSLKLNFVKYLFGVKCLLEFIVDSVRFLYTGVLGGLPNVDIFLRNMLGIDSMGKPRVG